MNCIISVDCNSYNHELYFLPTWLLTQLGSYPVFSSEILNKRNLATQHLTTLLSKRNQTIVIWAKLFFLWNVD